MADDHGVCLLFILELQVLRLDGVLDAGQLFGRAGPVTLVGCPPPAIVSGHTDCDGPVIAGVFQVRQFYDCHV